jgi:two-component system, cell cycle response regulator DivK
MAESLRPDIILMDVALGEMDGWEATTAIRSSPAIAKIPIIALTAHALESDRRRSIEVGCVDFETKPVALDQLIEKIERHIR